MTLGEKITKLRAKINISQEQLAEKMGVTRQTLSKWETNQVLPQVDKVLQMCDLFKVSCEQLLNDNIEINTLSKKKPSPAPTNTPDTNSVPMRVPI